MKRVLTFLAALMLAAQPALAADRKPVVIGATGQQQQIQAADTLSVPAAKVTGISGSTQCVQASSAGLLSGTGASCGGGGGTTVIGSTQVIAEVVTSGSQSSVTIPSIPGTYRDLRVVVTGRGTTAATSVNINLQFNGDSGANYDRNDTETNGASTGIGAAAAGTSMTIGYLPAATATASIGDTIESTVGNYAGTTFQKAVVSSSTLKISTATSGMYVIRSSGWWRSTAAVTSLTLTPAAGAFVDGTTVTVYGIGGTPAPITSVTSGLTLISSQTLSATAASVSFNSIPQGYTDLVLVANARGDTAAASTQLKLQFNGDTAANYDWNYVLGFNSAASSAANIADSKIVLVDLPAASAPSSTSASFEVQIPSYAGTTFHKTTVTNAGSRFGSTAAGFEVFPAYGDWRSTSAVTSFTLTPSAGNFVAGSTFQLYGRGGANVTINPQPGLPVICEVVTSGSAASVTVGGGLGSCPTLASTYRDLQVVVTGRGSTATNELAVKLQLNGDSGSNYDQQTAYFYNSNTESAAFAQTSVIGFNIPGSTGPSSAAGTGQFYIGNYAGTTFHKSVWAAGYWTPCVTAGCGTSFIGGGRWRSTSAVTSLTIFPASGNFVDGTVVTVYGIGGSPTATLPVIPPQGRLSLTTGVAVMTADATAQGTIYWVPLPGAMMPVGNIMYRVSSQLSYVLNTTAHTSGNLYDIGAYNSSGVITLCTAPAWTNSTTRAAAISQDATNGIWVNPASLTCNLSGGTTTTTIAAGQWTYLGTFYATANGQTGMAFQPTAASGGTNNILGLCNAYNTVPTTAREQDTGNWSVTSATWAALNASGTGSGLNNRISYVDCLGNAHVQGELKALQAGGNANIGMNRDSTTAAPNSAGQWGTTTNGEVTVFDSWLPSLGFHYIQGMQVQASGTTTIYASDVTPTRTFHRMQITLQNNFVLMPLALFRRRRRKPANDNAETAARAA